MERLDLDVRKRRRPLTEGEAGYVAAAIDGEGCISSSERREPGARRRRLCPRVVVTNTDLGMIANLATTAGLGQVYAQERPGDRPAIFRWVISRREAEKLLAQVAPRMTVKRAQAELALQYYRLAPPGVTSGDEALNGRLDEIGDRIAALNRAARSGGQATALRCAVEGCEEPAVNGWDRCVVHCGWGKPRLGARQCDRCGEEFEARYQRQRFCSAECRYRQWKEKSLRPRLEQARQERPQGTCPECGKLVDRSGYAGKVYCSEVCQQRAYHARRPSRGKRMSSLECEWCGVRFKSAIKTQRFCTARCRQAAWEAGATRSEGSLPCRCIECGVWFNARRTRAEYCSSACKQRAWKRRVGKTGKVRPEVACDMCGETFRPERATQHFCSTACRQRWHTLKRHRPPET